MISKKAIKEFLNRKLDNYDWLKKEKPAEIDSALAELSPPPDFKEVKLWLHQKVCFLLMIYLKRFMLFLDMGGGKTILSLMLIQYLKQQGLKPRAIVFVPYVITTETWVEETEKWTDLKCIPLIGTGIENLEDIKHSEADLFVICYQSAVVMMAKKEGNTDSRGNPKKGWDLKPDKIRRIFKDFDILIMDEVHKCGNVHSLTYRMCRAIAKESSWVLGLTGTPFGRDLQMLWSQFYLIDFGETLGSTLGLFREAFYSENTFFGYAKYTFRKRMLPKLKEMIKNRSIRYSIDECQDMPKKKYVVKMVDPTQGIAGYYNKIVESLENLSFGKTKYEQTDSEHQKLRQLSSGFMTLKGDDKSKVQVEFPENPKLDVLEEIIESMPEDSKAIVFHDFVYTNGMISKRLKQMKIKHARVYGKQNSKTQVQEIRKFKKDKDCRVIVINTQSGSSSQNLQMANYVIYFEQPRSAIDREQSERRAWRPGQQKRVIFFDLLMRGTVDKRGKKLNKEGKDLLQDVLDGGTKIKKLKLKGK